MQLSVAQKRGGREEKINNKKGSLLVVSPVLFASRPNANEVSFVLFLLLKFQNSFLCKCTYSAGDCCCSSRVPLRH